MNLFKKYRPALFALLCVYTNLGFYYLMMEFDHPGFRPFFILFRVLLAISVIMQVLIVVGIVRVVKK